MITPPIPNLSKENCHTFLLSIRMSGKNIKWLLQKQKGNQDRWYWFNKILFSKEEPYGTKNSWKYFIGYSDNDAIKPLCVRLPQITGYAKKFEINLTMSFKISDKELIKKYNV